MSKFPDDDELLSAIIDGEASAESIASVEADPERSQRLADMRSAVDIVAATPPAATTERRSASIAAAMAAATPASPEVTSLAAQRHKREEKKRSIPVAALAAAAAVLLFVLAIPVIFGLGGGGEVDVAADLADESANVGEAAEETTETDAVEESEEASDQDAAAAADTEVFEEPAEGETSGDEEAMEDEEEAAEEAAEPARASGDLDDAVVINTPIAQSIEELDELIAAGSLAPVLAEQDLLAREAPVARAGESVDEALATEVNPECLVASNGGNVLAYDIAVLDPFAGAAELVIIEFVDDGTTRVLNAETCEVIR